MAPALRKKKYSNKKKKEEKGGVKGTNFVRLTEMSHQGGDNSHRNDGQKCCQKTTECVVHVFLGIFGKKLSYNCISLFKRK